MADAIESLNLDTKNHQVKSPSTIDFSTATVLGLPIPTVPVTSVFGRTGAIVAQTGDYTFAQIGSKPTTLAGYGITDPVVLTSSSYADPAWITSLAWSKITGKPTTLSGYGITDAQPLDSDLTAIAALTTTSFGRGFLTQADAAASRTYIGAQAAGSYEPALGNPSTNGYILSSTTAGVRSWIAPPSSGIGGSTGSTDNAILRADGTGGATLQATGVTIDDTNNFSGFQRMYGTGSGNYIGWGDMMFGDVTGLGASCIGYNAAQSVRFRDNGGSIYFIFDNTNGLTLSKNLVVNSPNTISGKGAVPAGGTAGQVLSKIDATDYNLQWATAGAPAGQALTKTDDTNVTLALGGTPATALLAATSLTLGWTGVLAQSRGGTAVSAFGNLTAANDTNVTLTLGGTPAASVRTAVSITAGWTGTLAVARGGTGLATAGAGTVFANNTTGTAAPAWVTNPRITALPNLTSDGFVKTSGGIGTLSVDTSTYLTANQTITLSGDLSGSGSTSIAATVTPVTGTGNFVKSASPTFTGTAIFATINPSNITGTSTNDNAAAGAVGQVISSYLAFASSVSFTTNQTKNLTSISLTAGDWDVGGSISWTFSTLPASTFYLFAANIGLTTGSVSDIDGGQAYQALGPVASTLTGNTTCQMPPRRISVAATTTVYLVGDAPAFSSGAISAWGYIEARRAR